jgi:hypothetical protein
MGRLLNGLFDNAERSAGRAPFVQRLSQAVSDARSAAGDKDGVACEFHGWSSWAGQMR